MEIMKAVGLFLLIWSTASAQEPIATTPLGKVRGHMMTSRGGRKFMAFSGVPYAKPPVGNLTFQPSKPLEPWKGVKSAKENGPWCIQYNLYELKPEVFGQQDCLYLSVYTHNLKGRAPVLVHFHGGGFISGNGANKTGPQYFMDEEIVIIDVNYRVGIFGFLSFEDLDMPGNQGLKDQVMSLRWVQENVASFGGDPKKVTLVGESAGGGSVYHHTISPLSKGLFHGGIAESGTSYGLWCAAPEGFTRKLSMKLLTILGCNSTTTTEAVECIKSRDPKDVASKVENFREWQIDPIFNFGPVLEPEGPGAFITGPISSWKHNPVPLLMGTTSAEGLLRTQYFEYFNMSYSWYSDNFEKIAPISLLYFASAPNPNEVSSAVRKFYFPKGEITQVDWVNITTMYSDSWFTNSILDGANKHTGPVYFYYFDYVGEKSFGGDAATRNDSIIFGAPHTEEIIYIWYNRFFEGLTGNDLKLSERLVKMWVDFAKCGNPAPQGSNIEWEKWTQDKNRFLLIDKSGFTMKEGLAKDRYAFWNSLNYRGNYKS